MNSKEAANDGSMEDIPLDNDVAPEGAPPPKKIINEGSDQRKGSVATTEGVWESSLEDTAGCLSRMALSYLTPLLALGSHKVLDEDDIGVPSKQDEAERAFTLTLAAWESQMAEASSRNEKLRSAYHDKLVKCSTDEQRNKIKAPVYKEPSIAIALVSAFGFWKVIRASSYYLAGAILGFVPVLILNDLVTFFESGQSMSQYNGYVNLWVEVVALGVVPILVSLLQTFNQTTMAHCAVFARTAVSTLLYRKALRVSPAGRSQTSTGQVVNMMSNDTAQLQYFLQFLGMILASPVQIVVALALIYQQVCIHR